jgi:inosine-uridine nucleoside N-ribohydrolase
VDLWRRAGWEPNAHVAVDIRADDFLDLLIERLNSFA